MPVHVEGAARLRTTLRRSGIRASQLTDVNRSAARIVAAAARNTAPRRTGRLAATVRQAGSTTRTATVAAGTNVSVPYAGPIHWGWPARHITAQPWLSDTARATEPQWIRGYTAHMDRLITDVRGA